MPFQRKTLSTLVSEVAADISSALQGADALLRFAVLKVVGKVQAAMCNLQFGYLDWIARMAVPFTAEDEYLEGWAALKGVYRKAATKAQLTAQFPGTTGKVLSAGTAVARGDGVTYTTSTTGHRRRQRERVGDDRCRHLQDLPEMLTPAPTVSLSVAVDGIQQGGAITGRSNRAQTLKRTMICEAGCSTRTRITPQGGDRRLCAVGACRAGVTRAWCAPMASGLVRSSSTRCGTALRHAHNGFPQGTDGVSQNDKGPGGTPRGVVALAINSSLRIPSSRSSR
jgi:uncharacterized phage protein gp47/JayE